MNGILQKYMFIRYTVEENKMNGERKMKQNKGISFGQMLDEVEEGDKVECVDYRYDNICCIDNEVLVWEQSQEYVRLNGAFWRMKWRILKGESTL